MNPVPLQLRHTPGSHRDTAAWFIPGPNAAAWLEEICRWQIPQAKLRLFVLPRSIHDRFPAGVFIPLPPGLSPQEPPRGLAFTAAGEKLFLPIHSQLWPPVELPELRFRSDLLVFHPGIGLVGFDLADALSVSDLLRQPPSRVENWNFARAGRALNDQLRSVQLLAPLDPAQLFGDASNEIGSEPLNQLPPAPSEPGNGPLSKAAQHAKRLLAMGLAAAMRALPHTGNKRNWINRLQEWAAARAAKISEALQDLRNKEIRRLLNQLETNPEQGLRFAVSLGGSSHRGIAPPGNRLASRDPSFQLGHLQGGGPADIWHLPADLQLQLRNKYRELANRELNLGRYRRAAYIFAELLGDLPSAAAALKQGKHFREAAILYKDYLHQPREAAHCLAEGGLVLEAIEIYEAQACFVEAGDLCLRIGQADKANAFYEREVQRLLAADDYLAAAQFIETKLAAPERALAVLDSGWPHSAQAARCVEAHFNWLARHAKHRQAVSLVARLRAESTSAGLLVPLAQLLAHQACHYPDHSVRRAAADVVRVKAAEYLERANAIELGQLTEAITRLAREDKLLARDATRFCYQRKARTSPVAHQTRETSAPVQIRSFKLPDWIRWHGLKSCGPYFFASGMSDSKFFLFRGRWNGAGQALSWPGQFPESAGLTPYLVEFDYSTASPSRVVVMPSPTSPVLRLPMKSFPAADQFPVALPAGTPDFLPNDLLRVSLQDEFIWVLRNCDNGLLECRHFTGRLVSNMDVSDCFAESRESFFGASLLVQRDLTWIANGQQLFLLHSPKPGKAWNAESPILGLVSSAPHLPLGIVARLARGVSIHRADHLKENTETLFPDFFNPLAAFTANGTLVLLAERGGCVCHLTAGGIESVAQFPWPGAKPIAVARAEGPDQFAVLTRDGQVTVFRSEVLER